MKLPTSELMPFYTASHKPLFSVAAGVPITVALAEASLLLASVVDLARDLIDLEAVGDKGVALFVVLEAAKAVIDSVSYALVGIDKPNNQPE